MRALLLALSVGCAPALDVAGEVAFGAALAADYVQTRQITRDGYEGNPLIGRWGERTSPEAYFAAAALLHAGVAILLPRPWRQVWQGGWCVVEGVAVWNNYVDGYTFDW